ncbi:uncharacterized protein LOC109854713 isoform X3 [Pseudomyrmex gracilis]|uniref:uncharacterized protein LOC109854713 isoform X3 n=1 Tax=Pseudomyrmex gracilis TaxID=219809 RepID=UPI000995D37F|nr:uncharacterized protein LOC109854713 isoform X3 [Pseudomyrmex gracilis]
MAQYYNLVTNAGSTFTIEEVPRVCTVDGQPVQLVVENVNNSGNSSQQLVACPATSQNREAIFPSHTINLGNQIAATRLEQGQDVFIIKTNNIASTQEILKSNIANAHTTENIVKIVDHSGIKTDCKNERQTQWIKMQNAATTTVLKPNTLLQERNQTATVIRNNTQNDIVSPVTNNIGVACQTSDKLNVITTMENRIQNSHVATPRPAMSVNSKSINHVGQNIVRPTRSNTSMLHVRPVAIVPPEISKTSVRVQGPEMKCLNEHIKQAKLKMQLQQKQHIEKQKCQNNPQRQQQQQQLPNTLHPVQSSLNLLQSRRSITPNSVQQKTQQISMSPQPQQIQKQSVTASPAPSAETNRHVTSTNVTSNMEVDLSECTQEKEIITQQSPSLQLDHEKSSSESVAYLQKTINDPKSAIVQQQINGNKAKMLVILTSGEQRLITFDIPNEDCTVHDLLVQVRAVMMNQVNISFSGSTVSLVDDPALGINYIVDVSSRSAGTNSDNDHTDSTSNSTQEIVSSTTTNSDILSQNTNASDENSNTSFASTEEPILVKGMLALCPHCGYSSLHFNRCERCNTKLSEEVKSIPIAQKECGISVDIFYKKNNERNTTRLEKTERDGPTCKRPRGKGKGTPSKPKPIHKEPECLTISSDEEDEGKAKKIGNINNNTLGHASNSFNEEVGTILEKEPIITTNCIFSSYNDFKNDEKFGTGTCDNESFVDNEQALQTAIECRTVRIGSYKYIPREKIVVSRTGVKFNVPLLEDDTSFITLDVKYRDIVKLLIHFGKTMPVLFFYTTTNTGTMIRELLGMQDPKGPYYDPAGKDHTHKRITLLPDKLADDSRAIITALFARGDKMEELNPKEANDILLRASPRDNQSQVQSITTRKQSQNSASSTVSANEPIQTITVYPPPPAKGGIAINTEDYLCLAEDQFLNDVIIDFYLKYLTLEVLSESDQQRTHVFSSYFYKRLTSPHAQAAESVIKPITPAAKRHARVQKWTKNVNIFEKDFIIIPINEHAHWFLAIICFPGLVGKVNLQTNENNIYKTVQKSKKVKELKKAVTIGSTTITPVPTTITIEQDEGSERDEAEGDDEEMEMDSDEEDETEESEENSTPSLVKTEQQKDTVKIPCILIFDSLAGASRARVVATLRDYLMCEHIAKLGVEKTFSKDTIKGACPKVPQQSNFTDCGLYVLQYVESFFKLPITDYTLPIKTLKTWFEEIVVTRKREELSKLLIRLMNDTKGDKTINLPNLNFPTQDGKLKPKSENQTDAKTTKPEVENKKKPTNVDAETRIVSFVTENNESSDFVSRTTFQIIPYSVSSSNSTESNPTEMNEQKPTRSSSETMSYLKSKRIPRLVSKTQNQEDSQVSVKKHKGESYNSCK